MIDCVSACGRSCTAASTATRGRVMRNDAPRSMRSSSGTTGTATSLQVDWRDSRLCPAGEIDQRGLDAAAHVLGVAQPEFEEDGVDVALDGALGDDEVLGDRGIAEALGD